jgi:uncharacterized protein YndB with AHSA1/START domain
MRGEVTVHMNASPADVFALVSDVTRIGRYSPETFEAVWLDGATEPKVGARFKGHVKRNGKGPIYWTTCEVTTCEPGKEFAFAVLTRGRPLNTWRYVIEPTDGGCDVTESFELLPDLSMRVYWAVLGWARGRTNQRGMRATLNGIKKEVEAQP